jgi:hypothetical protein
MFSLIVEAMSHLWLALEDMLLFKETIGTRRVARQWYQIGLVSFP